MTDKVKLRPISESQRSCLECYYGSQLLGGSPAWCLHTGNKIHELVGCEKWIGKNIYNVFDVNRGSFTIDATTAKDALERLGYHNIEKTEMGNIHINGLSGDKRNYVFTATYCNKEGDK